jgi:hypothetical protein
MLTAAGGLRRALAGIGGAVAGGAPFLALALLYNRALTGDAFHTPYAAYAAKFSPWDVYPYFQLEQVTEPVAIAVRALVRQSARWTPALFGLLGAMALGFWGLWRLRRRDGGAALALAALLPLAYSLHWYPGHWAYLGPLYSYEVLGFMTIGALHVLDAAPPRWRAALVPAALVGGVA